MKKIIYLFASVCFLASCNNEKASETKVKTSYSYPITYSEWEIGNSENIKTVLNFYTAWDSKDVSKIASLFADTVRMRLPSERNEIWAPNNEINEKLIANRGMYDSTSNNILSAVSLHDRESNEDWVMINTYSKWVEKDGKRDSVLYHDSWRLKNGKIDFLMSFYKLPTETFLKRNDTIPSK